MQPPISANHTIAAIATGAGGSLAVIRVSGPAALAVAGRVWQARLPLPAAAPRTLHRGRLVDATGSAIDDGLAVVMPGPHSYTGEDIVEFHLHGGGAVARAALAVILAAGARAAAPGEFTKRAFLNGKLDLTQAEAVADLIAAQSEAALRLANRQLDGRLGRQIDQLHAELAGVLAEVEARLDFPDEHLDFQPAARLQEAIGRVRAAVGELRRSGRDGHVLRDGLRVAIVGAPNAGKSSLLNLLLGQARAIVTAIPGTTRDTVEETLVHRGVPLRLVDTAGLRPATDAIEQHGVDRALAALRDADLVLWVLDSTRPLAEQPLDPALLAGKPVIALANKHDLQAQPDFACELGRPVLPFCALTGAGLPALHDELERAVWGAAGHAEPDVAVNARHAALLNEAAAQLDPARDRLGEAAWELAAVNLRVALNALGRITGRTVTPDLLDDIFSHFCIGK